MHGQETFSWRVLSVGRLSGDGLERVEARGRWHVRRYAGCDGGGGLLRRRCADLRSPGPHGPTAGARVARHPVGAVCTGTYVLARAGLLDGYRCTIHWENQDSLREQFPQIDVTEELFEIDRTRFTCAGGTAAIDMMLALIAHQQGQDVASGVTDQLIHHRMRDGDERQRMELRSRLGVAHPKLISVVARWNAASNSPCPASISPRAPACRHASWNACSANISPGADPLLPRPPAHARRQLLLQTSMPDPVDRARLRLRLRVALLEVLLRAFAPVRPRRSGARTAESASLSDRIRLRDRGSRLGRLRAGQPPLGGWYGVRPAARDRRERLVTLHPHAERARHCNGHRADELELPQRARTAPRRASRHLSARQGAGRSSSINAWSTSGAMVRISRPGTGRAREAGATPTCCPISGGRKRGKRAATAIGQRRAFAHELRPDGTTRSTPPSSRRGGRPATR